MHRRASLRSMVSPALPFQASRITARINSEKVTRLCARAVGVSEGTTSPRKDNFPVKTALPNVADAPQQNVAAAIYRYPSRGCLDLKLACEHLLQSFRIEADHDFVTHNDSRRGAALILPYQFAHERAVHSDVFYFKLDPSLREVGLCPIARRSTRLTEYDHFLV